MDDIYSAAMWYLWYATPDAKAAAADLSSIEIDSKMRAVLEQMVKRNPQERISAKLACKKLAEFVKG
jgi:hypothetical protein